MIRLIALFALILTHAEALAAGPQSSEAALRILMTVGGVGYNTSIIRMLKNIPGGRTDHPRR
ncbi:MAG: hypothetical protein KJO31_14860 [Gammaproteobacteria bacterium]|nr:hypothetical protein [Gammaproteobacteria bacterium]